jgi:hypothetical protein
MLEVLVHRRLGLIANIISECELTIRVLKVTSEQNKADELTRVRQRWPSKEIQNIASVALEKMNCSFRHAVIESTGVRTLV